MSNANERFVIIGAGSNGLVAAYYLAKAGLRPLVLERRNIVGGLTVTDELHPGFRCCTLLHCAPPVPAQIARDLQLKQNGLSSITPDIRIFAPNTERGPLRIYEDADRTIRELAAVSAHDADAYPKFRAAFTKIGRVIEPALLLTPPDLKNPAFHDVWTFGRMGLRLHSLPRKDAFSLLRWTPMAVADLASEWFESESLRAIIAARGIYGAFAGPRSGGTSAWLVAQAAISGDPIPSAVQFKGGIGTMTQTMAKVATTAGAELRTGVEAALIGTKGGKVSTVTLTNGEEIPASTVISSVNPKTTFLRMVDPGDLNPDFLWKIRSYRSCGSAAKVNLALSGLPPFSDAASEDLSGRIHLGTEVDYIERAFDAAKYGDYSSIPYMDVMIPSVMNPSLAPKGAHVMSVHVQYVPYRFRTGDWESRREEFGNAVVKALSQYCPGLERLIVARQIITPLDLEKTYGLGGGHILHGEPTLDQLFAFRPLLGWARYRTPITGLYICGQGTHPVGVTGASGANASREVLRDLKSKNS